MKCWITETSNERLALETYALQGGQFTYVDSVDKTNFWVFHSRTQHHWETNCIIFMRNQATPTFT